MIQLHKSHKKTHLWELSHRCVLSDSEFFSGSFPVFFRQLTAAGGGLTVILPCVFPRETDALHTVILPISKAQCFFKTASPDIGGIQESALSVIGEQCLCVVGKRDVGYTIAVV